MDGLVSRWVDLGGPVHYADFGGPASPPDDAPAGQPGPPTVVCLHGLGGSYANWVALAPLLTGSYRVLALDLAGFGLTPAAGRSSSVQANAALAARFVAEVIGGPAIWVGNSMGALITLLMARDQPELVSRAVLIDPAHLPMPRHRPDPLSSAAFATYFVPGLGRAVVGVRRRARSAEQTVHDTLVFCCHDARRVSPSAVAEHVAVVRARERIPGVERDFEVAARSVLAEILRRRAPSAAGSGLAGDLPVLLLHGGRDRLVPLRTVAAVAAAHPRWRFAVAEGVGHLPMLEDPAWTARQIRGWLNEVGAGPVTNVDRETASEGRA